MRAVVIATGRDHELGGLAMEFPAPLVHVANRPFLHHVIEHLVERGIRDIDFILHDQPEMIETDLRDGSRWGGRFTYHLIRNGESSMRRVQVLAPDWGEDPVLLAGGLALPRLPEDLSWMASCRPAVIEGVDGWSGWAVVPSRTFAEMPADLEEEQLPDWLEAFCMGTVRRVRVDTILRIRTGAEVVAANRAVQTGGFPGIFLEAHETEKGIWVGRGLSIHPTARLNPPVLLGDGCAVGRDAVVGPYAVVGVGTIIESGAEIKDSVLYPGTYVGQDLDLIGCIVRKNQLLKVDMNTVVTVPETFLLGSVDWKHVRERLAALPHRAVALATLVLMLPLALVTGLFVSLVLRRPVLARRRVVRLPAAGDPNTWRSFDLLTFNLGRSWTRTPGRVGFLDRLARLPALWNVVRGDMVLIGLQPRSRDEVLALPGDWQRIHLRSGPGLISPQDVAGPESRESDAFVTEAVFDARLGTRLMGRNLGILWRWVF